MVPDRVDSPLLLLSFTEHLKLARSVLSTWSRAQHPDHDQGGGESVKRVCALSGYPCNFASYYSSSLIRQASRSGILHSGNSSSPAENWPSSCRISPHPVVCRNQWKGNGHHPGITKGWQVRKNRDIARARRRLRSSAGGAWTEYWRPHSDRRHRRHPGQFCKMFDRPPLAPPF